VRDFLPPPIKSLIIKPRQFYSDDGRY
jgi:hypothetical protein